MQSGMEPAQKRLQCWATSYRRRCVSRDWSRCGGHRCRRVLVDEWSLQVSDREAQSEKPETITRDRLIAAQLMVTNGEAEEILLRDWEMRGAPICARRFLALVQPGGDDDMFSSDLNAEELKVVPLRRKSSSSLAFCHHMHVKSEGSERGRRQRQEALGRRRKYWAAWRAFRRYCFRVQQTSTFRRQWIKSGWLSAWRRLQGEQPAALSSQRVSTT